jgi:hypothetical protein
MPLTYLERLFLDCGLTFLFVALLGLLGAALVFLGRGRTVREAGKRPGARTEQEELVRRWLVRNSGKSAPVEFLGWGPHMTKPEWEALWREAEAAPPHPADALTRVRFRGRWWGQVKTHDLVFVVQGRTVLGGAYPGGPDWKKNLRNDLGREYPGVHVED